MGTLTLKHFKKILTAEQCKTVIDHVSATPKENVKNIRNEYGEVPLQEWYGINVIPYRFRFPFDTFDFLSDAINNKTPYNYNDWALKYIYVNTYHTGEECLRHLDLDTKGRKDAVAQGKDFYTGIILLNDDFEGGILKVGNNDMPVELELGDLVLLNGRTMSHLVTEITKGERHTLVVWGKYM